MPVVARVIGLTAVLLGALLASDPMAAASPASTPAPIAWRSWNDDVFVQAQREHRLVILDLQAMWCHWCHVMEQETYAAPAVAKLVGEHYLAVQADQDANPDLSNRYGDWGWPATIVFAPDGTELVKRRGFIAPENMASLLQAVVDDPTPGPSVRESIEIAASPNGLAAADRSTLQSQFVDAYDADHGGWGFVLKYIDAPAMELALERARRGDKAAEQMARQTLDANLSLIDPVWGGVYQYSDKVDWSSPHFEKIMSYQADDLRLYALAYAQFGDARYLKAAQAIRDYLKAFLTSPDGAFYVSQDADLSRQISGHEYYPLDAAARRARGLPRIDKHLYARENGWAISALARFSDAAGDAEALADAQSAARWVLAHRALPGGGFRHDAKDRGGPFLGDTVAMGAAFLNLYRSTGDRQWLAHASAALAFIDKNFRDPSAGFDTAPAPRKAAGVFAKPIRLYEENIAVASLATLAFHYSGDARAQALAVQAQRYLNATALVESGRFLPGVLLADLQSREAPVHITVVGAKTDPVAQALYAAARGYPAANLRLDWWDRREGPLPNSDVQYPQFDKAAAYSCTGNACSSPVFDAEKLRSAVDRVTRVAAP